MTTFERWRRSPDSERLTLAVVALVTLWAVVLIVTGGVDLRSIGVRFSSRDPFRPAGIALGLAAVYVLLFRERARERLAVVSTTATRRAPFLALGVTLFFLVVSLKHATYVAGGADSYGYVSQADLWLAGNLTIEQPVAHRVPWGDANWTFAPLGYRPALTGSAIVPVYPAGLPMLMAFAKLVAGTCGPYLVVPVFGAAAVWLTYLLGARTVSTGVGVVSAALFASSPAFLFLSLMPMSDVPVTAFVVGAAAVAVGTGANRAVWVGLILSGAVLVRPNLVPLVALFAVYFLLRGPKWRARAVACVSCGVGTLPVIIFIAVLHTHLYGAPWKSGYGDLEGFYDASYFVKNLQRYPVWLLQTQTPLIAALFLPLVAIRWFAPEARPRLLLLGALTLAMWLSYMFYMPLDEWWSLRFLLPAYPPMLILAAAGWRMMCARAPDAYRPVLLAGIVFAVGTYQVGRIQDYSILRLDEGDRPFVSVARHIDAHLPPNAIIVSMLHSGSVRHYSGRLTIRYDWLEPEWWPRAITHLSELGYRPYVLLDLSEEAPFRTRFGLSERPDAPGAVIAELNGVSRVRIYDPLMVSGPLRGRR